MYETPKCSESFGSGKSLSRSTGSSFRDLFKSLSAEYERLNLCIENRENARLSACVMVLSRAILALSSIKHKKKVVCIFMDRHNRFSIQLPFSYKEMDCVTTSIFISVEQLTQYLDIHGLKDVTPKELDKKLYMHVTFINNR